MADKISKLQRWMDLVAFLAGRRFPVSQDDLWARIPAYAQGLEGGGKNPESVRRMFERDKDELRSMGIPIETVTFHINQGSERSHGYRLATRDFHLPYLRLIRAAEQDEPTSSGPAPTSGDFVVHEAEATAALEGLRELATIPGFPLRREARSAFRKMAFDLDPELLIAAPVLYVEEADDTAAADTLRHVSEALLVRQRVAFLYRSLERDDTARRTVRPYGLLFQHGRWYLVGWAEDRDGIRMFRVSRMGEITPAAKGVSAPQYEIPEDFDLGTYAGRNAWELGEGETEPRQALVRFRFPRSLWAERNGYGVLVEEAEDGSQLRRMPVHREQPFLRWLLSLEGDARVVDPPELTSAFRAMVASVAERYQPTPGGQRG